MTREDHLLDILAEECAEVAIRVSKALRFGLDEVEPGQGENNRRRIEEELRDLLTAAQMLEDGGILSGHWREPKVEKVVKVERFLRYSKDCGRLGVEE